MELRYKFGWRIQWSVDCLALCILLSAASANALCDAAAMSTSRNSLGLRLNAGERLIAIQPDHALGLAWGVVMDCNYPERPARMVALLAAKPVNSPAAQRIPAAHALVRAGEKVLLWRQDAMSRVETSGIAEEGGVEGQNIRVRLARVRSDLTQGKDSVTGIVRGDSSVEILQ